MLTLEQSDLILTPFLLLGTTRFAFQKLVFRFGTKTGYLGGFLFYWIIWCFGISWWILGAVFPSSAPGGNLALVVVAGLVGLMWGWVAWQTGSILWTTVSHIFFDFSGLGGRIYSS